MALAAIDPTVGALRSTGDLEDDDHVLRIVDQIDHAKETDAQAPEVRPRELHRARGTRLDPECEDRAAQAGGIARRETSKLTLGGGR
jgi:hypothetical protein